MYHLTAQNVIGHHFPPEALGGAEVALMGFCPRPSALNSYSPVQSPNQFFIHVAPESVQFLTCGAHKVVSLHHLYGGPVGSATVEDLAYYGIKYILSYGLAGGLGTPACSMGDYYLVKDAFAADGTTRHYTQKQIIAADSALSNRVNRLWLETHEKPMCAVRAATGDAIYREDDSLLAKFRSHQCDIVNLDTSHLYAVSQTNGQDINIATVQCGVVSDVVSADSTESETSLGKMLTAEGSSSHDPMSRVNDIVTFYLDSVVPSLMDEKRAG